jgi:hypothetical protein
MTRTNHTLPTACSNGTAIHSIIWMIFSVNQCVIVNFIDVNGARMLIGKQLEGNENANRS